MYSKYLSTMISLAAFTLAVALSGCIRDEIPDCTGLKVNITVEDKNYANIDEIEDLEAVPDNLPFSDYVPNLFCSLIDPKTGDVVESLEFPHIDGNAEDFTVQFCDCHPYGEYIVTIWGGYLDYSQISADGHSIETHPGGHLGGDIYFSTGRVKYDENGTTYDMQMRRVMGKLVVVKEWLNENPTIDSSLKTVTNIYGRAYDDGTYDSPGTVEIPNSWQAASKVVSSFPLAPTAEGGSKIDIVLPDPSAQGKLTLHPAPVDITIERNEVTVVKYIWSDDLTKVTVALFVNGEWRTVSSLKAD